MQLGPTQLRDFNIGDKVVPASYSFKDVCNICGISIVDSDYVEINYDCIAYILIAKGPDWAPSRTSVKKEVWGYLKDKNGNTITHEDREEPFTFSRAQECKMEFKCYYGDDPLYKCNLKNEKECKNK